MPGIIVCNLILIITHVAHYFPFFPGCHSPPVSDKELIAIIKAFNAVKHNPAAKLIWQCGICTKIKNAVNQQNRQSIAVKKATARQFAASQKATIVIDDDDDDDEIIALDGPSEVPKRNETTNPEVDRLSNTVPQRSSTTQDTFSHSRRRSSNAASDDLIQPPPRRTSGTKDKHIRIIDDPFLVPDFTPPPAKPPQTPLSTKLSEFVDLTVSSDEGDASDDALEYLTPAPTSKQVVEIREEVPQILTSNQANPSLRDASSTAQTSALTNTSSQLLNHLLTRWLNDRHTSVGVKPDIWTRACLRRDLDAANRRSLGSKSPHPPSPPSRRKFRARNLSERSLTHSQATVFLSAEAWLHEKQASLLLE